MSEEKQIAIQNLEKYIKVDPIYNGSREKLSDFDEFCINHCLDIQIALELIEKQDKMIDLMAEDLKIGDEYLSSEYNFTGYENYTIEQIKEEYRKKVEND